MQKELFELYWMNINCIEEISKCVQAIRQQNYHLTRIQMPIVTRQMTQWVSFLTRADILEVIGEMTSIDTIMDALQQIALALESDDYILVADLYELLIKPMLAELQSKIREQEDELIDTKWLDNNISAIDRANKNISQQLTELTIRDTDKVTYQIEDTTVGAYTLAIVEGNTRYYLHSNYDPLEEARIYARRIYDSSVDRYVIVGWGMGYHIHELLMLDPDLNIVVYEPDLKLLYIALHYMDYTNILERVRFVKGEKELLNLVENEYRLVLYRPELRHLKNEQIKEKLVRIAERQDSVDTHRELFRKNFESNIRNCTNYIDELRGLISGKKVLVVAGGPSLDKNIEYLIDKPDNFIIIAVGTVYKLLLERKIKVDLVLFSDVAAYPQIKGITESEIPIAVLSTADSRIGRQYQGPKYLICQQGYEVARKYAVEREYMCYDSGGSVATLALDVAIRLEAGSIAFVGLDLAYIGKQAHATGTQYETFSGEKMQIVTGVNGEELNTSQAFNHYRLWMERRIQKKDVTMPIIDATEGGAKKKGFLVMSLREYLK